MATILMILPLILVILVLSVLYCFVQRTIGPLAKTILGCLFVAGWMFALNGIVFQEVTDQMNRKVEGYQIYGIIGFVLVSAIYWGVVWCICAVSGPILWINKITTVSDEEKRETKRSQDLENMDPELKELLQKLKQI